MVLLLPSSPLKWYVIGIAHAALVILLQQMMVWSFVAHHGEAIAHLRGAWGEDNTRDALKRAKRKNLIWGWVDSVTLQAGDIDHLVVTRSGGVIAIDSKWRNKAQAADRDALASSARKVALRATGLLRTLLASSRGHHRARINPTSVRPLVVLWGTIARNVPARGEIDGIDYVAGSELLAWLGERDGDPVDKDAAHDLLMRLEQFRATAWSSATAPPRIRAT